MCNYVILHINILHSMLIFYILILICLMMNDDNVIWNVLVFRKYIKSGFLFLIALKIIYNGTITEYKLM